MLTTDELQVLQALVNSVRHNSCSCQLPSPHTNFPNLDTPYTKYINTPFAATSEHDVHAITKILRQRQVQLNDVAAEITSVETFMKRAQDVHQQFLDKQDKIFASLGFHRGLLSCIRRLPAEILSKIFVLCLPSETHIEPNVRSTPLVLSSICREWRKIALEMPRLWCSLVIRPSHRREEQLDLPFYNGWLSRASDRPLSLILDMRPSQQNPKWPHYLMSLFHRYSNHTTRLHIIFDESDVIFSSMMLRDMPTLEHLTFKGNRNEFAMRISIEQPEPRLRSFTLEGVKLRRGSTIQSVFELGWVHLTHLRINFDPTSAHDDHTDGDSVFTFLTLCPRLQAFDFSPISIPRSEVENPRELIHTHLRSLDVFVLHGVGRFLNALTLPALRHFGICDVKITRRTWWRHELKTFMERSQCPLETLSIHGGKGIVTQEDQAACAALIPTLKHLDLSSNSDGVVEGLIRISGAALAIVKDDSDYSS